MSVSTLINEKYEIKEEIKRGGFGIIYRGIDNHFGKPIAIKTIDPQLLGEAKYIDMFQHEALNIAQLNHHNIVQIYDISREENGQLYIIMEYLDGCNFMSLLRACKRMNKPLSTHLTVHIISEICNGLEYAHNRRHIETNKPLNIVHQDISPLNIMTTNSGQVKIIDFGMASLRSYNSKKTDEIQIQGNIHYLAPEQVRDSGHLDRRVDIFAIGLILFEVLVGERLIHSDNPTEIVKSLINGSWDLSRLNKKDIPNELKEVILKSIAHNPKNRYQSANQMYRDLMHYLILTSPAADFMFNLANFVQEVKPAIDDSNGNIREEHTTNLPQAEKKEHGTEPITTEPEFEYEPTPLKSLLESKPDAEVQQPNHEPEENETLFDFSENKVEPTQNKTEPVENPVETQAVSSDASPSFYSFVEESEDDDQRTIIDVVRLSARSHKKGIITTLVSLIVGCLLFTVVDTFTHFTAVGSNIYDFLFPPDIKIVSVPPGAEVYLDDEPLNQKTPLNLDQISPGIHKLMLTLPKYESIIKSINVPRKGDIRISGEASRRASRPFVLKFKQQLELTSKPSGAEIILDGIRLNQRTPATVYWEVGAEPTSIEMEIAGLPRLAGLQINSIDDAHYIEDRRLWTVNNVVAGQAHYGVHGIFHKSVTIKSNPKLADIIHNESEKAIGVTGLSGTLMLPVGDHIITLKKNGYLPNTFNLSVNEESGSLITRDLQRIVRIFSKDIVSETDRDLGAKLVHFTSRGQTVNYNRKTPVILQLLPYRYTVKLVKEGYKDLFIDISPTQKTVIAKLEPDLLKITIDAIDTITNDPIKAVQVSYKPEGSAGPEEYLGLTDGQGSFTGKIKPGVYEFSITKNGYQDQRKNMQVATGQSNHLTFRLTVMSFGPSVNKQF